MADLIQTAQGQWGGKGWTKNNGSERMISQEICEKCGQMFVAYSREQQPCNACKGMKRTKKSPPFGWPIVVPPWYQTKAHSAATK